jgi:hypothetical protein
MLGPACFRTLSLSLGNLQDVFDEVVPLQHQLKYSYLRIQSQRDLQYL